MFPSVAWPWAAKSAAVAATAIIVAGTAMAQESGSATGFAGAYLAASSAQANDDAAAATGFLEDVLEQDPGNEDLLTRAFTMALAGGQSERAADLARRLGEVQPRNQLARVMLAIDAGHRGDFDQMADEAAALGEGGLAGLLGPLLSAWASAGQGDVEAAVSTLVGGFDDAALEPLVGLHMGLVLDYSGSLSEARDAYETTLTIGNSLRLTQALGSLYERTGAPERARALYELYLADAPDSLAFERALLRVSQDGVDELAQPLVRNPAGGVADALFQLASSQSQDASDISLLFARMALMSDPDLQVGLVLMGDILAARGQSDEALATFERVDRTSALGWSAQLNRARMMSALERMEDAVALLRELADERPNRTDALVLMGDLLRGDQQYAQAVLAYDEAAQRDGALARDDWNFKFRRGIALERSTDWARANEDLTAAAALNPDSPQLLNYLGYSLIDRGERVDEAEDLISRAVELRPGDGFIVDSLGWVYYRTGRLEQAVETLERAVELQPGDPVLNDHLGDAYWMIGRRVEARFQWQHALATVSEDNEDLIPAIEAKLVDGLPEDTGVLPGY